MPAYFESPAHRIDVLGGIVSGTLPLKYAYAGSAAHTHSMLARSGGYLSVIGPTSLEAQAWGCLPPGSRPSALAEIGPGNGVHTNALLGDLQARGAPVRRYLGLDFSETLLSLCSKRLAAAGSPNPIVHTGVWDVESGPTSLIHEWRRGGEPIVVGLFGQTIGNVEDASTTLANVHDSLEPGDTLVLTLALRRHDEPSARALAPYRSGLFHDAVLEPMRAAGIAAGDMDLRMSFLDDTVVGEVELRREVTIDGHRLAAGHRVRCFRSRRFVPDQVPQLLDRAYWSTRAVVFDDEMEHAVVIGARKAG
jgi:L-histidine N-alpha-methyltransferase